MAQAAGTTAQKSAFGLMLDYFRDFKILGDNPIEYWAVQIVNFLDCTAYFAMLNILTLFLSEDLGINDEQAGLVFTVVTSTTTIFLLFSGVATDVLGIRKSLNLSMIAKLVLCLLIGVVAFSPPWYFDFLSWHFNGRGVLVGILLVLMAPFLAMVQTVFQAANRRFTTSRSRSAGFNLWYLFMNIGAAFGGLSVDFFRLWLRDDLGIPVPQPNTFVIGIGIVTSLLSLIVTTLLIRSEKQVYGPDEKPAESPVKKEKRSGWQVFRSVIHESAFWRFLVLIALLLGTRAVFVYMNLLMPKYWVRVIGDNAAIGSLNTINPILIIFGLVLFIPFSNRFNIFKMLVFGCAVSALSLFALLIPWQAIPSFSFSTWTFGAPTVEFSYYTMAVIAMIVLSIGEVIWSPKLSEYTAAIAPEGQEGTYLGMSMMPWFLAKMVVSALSGFMLVRFCPQGIGDQIRDGTVSFWHSPEAMWLILGAWAMAGPVLAWILRGWLTKGARWTSEQPGARVDVEPA